MPAGRKHRYGRDARYAAISAMLVCGGVLAAGVAYFKETCPDPDIQNHRKFVERWWRHYATAPPNSDWLADDKRAPKHKKLNDLDARRAANIFAAGHRKDGHPHTPWFDWGEVNPAGAAPPAPPPAPLAAHATHKQQAPAPCPLACSTLRDRSIWMLIPVCYCHWQPCFGLQTKRGAEAQGLTAQEFAARATVIHRAATAACSKDPAAWGYHVRFSWDHASAHDSALDDIDILPEQLLDRPTRSPDLHRVIETPFSEINKVFHKKWDRNPAMATVPQAIQLLYASAKKVCTPEYIQALCNALPKTYTDCIRRGGDWVNG